MAAAAEGRPPGRTSVTFKDTSASSFLGASASAPSLLTTSGAFSANGTCLPASTPGPGVSLRSLQQFLFPATLENPDAVGRLELFARYGPADENGLLRGGVSGAHAHTDLEIKQMVAVNSREALFAQFKKPRSTVESVVDTLLPVAMAQKYTWSDVLSIIRSVEQRDGRMDFSELQQAIIASQRQRLQGLIRRAKSGKPVGSPSERLPRVPFQSQTAVHLTELTRRGKLADQERDLSDYKRLHSSSALIASLEDQQQTAQLRANVLLLRGPGGVDDRWDRYCAMRRTGRSSYVRARNEGRFNPSMDDGMSNKHPSCSSLLAASADGSSAAMLLGAR